MDPRALRLLIQEKLDDGRLPQDSIPRVWGGAGNGEICRGCDEVVTPRQIIMEGLSAASGQAGVQFHVKCFYLWDTLRQVPGHDASGPGLG